MYIYLEVMELSLTDRLKLNTPKFNYAKKYSIQGTDFLLTDLSTYYVI
jgi:hypothetical protein